MIAACLKWVDHRPEFDAYGAPSSPDARFAGVSAADQAALEWALRCRDAWLGTGAGNGPDTGSGEYDEVVAITVGPAEADTILKDALVAGATRAVRVDLPFGTPSRVVAACIAPLTAHASLVVCGDYSSDRGTGSVPAFLAHELGFAQALGLIDIDLVSPRDTTALRRLDGGRRERLAIVGPIVVSVEGSTARLRRAPLRSMLGAKSIETVPGIWPLAPDPMVTLTRPYRPRPRVLAAPIGATALDRVRAITDASTTASHGETVALEPAAAADRVLATLREWGYVGRPR